MPITGIQFPEAQTVSDRHLPTAASPGTTERPASTAVLFISPVRQDQAELRRILDRTHRTIATATCRQARRQIREGVPIVLCDQDLPDGTWLDILGQVAASSDPPLLIVTSRVADERLWAEVLNLGGFDLIAKPFAATEVLHVVKTAWDFKRGQCRSAHFAGGA